MRIENSFLIKEYDDYITGNKNLLLHIVLLCLKLDRYVVGTLIVIHLIYLGTTKATYTYLLSKPLVIGMYNVIEVIIK